MWLNSAQATPQSVAPPTDASEVITSVVLCYYPEVFSGYIKYTKDTSAPPPIKPMFKPRRPPRAPFVIHYD